MLKHIGKAHLEEYTFDRNRSIQGSGGDRLNQAEPPLVTLDIETIEVNMSGSQFRKLGIKKGDEIEFKISQTLKIWDSYAEEHFEHFAYGTGTGTVEYVEDDVLDCPDEETADVMIYLKDGLGEEL